MSLLSGFGTGNFVTLVDMSFVEVWLLFTNLGNNMLRTQTNAITFPLHALVHQMIIINE